MRFEPEAKKLFSWSFFFSPNTCSRLCIFLCTALLLSEYFVFRKRHLNFSKKLLGEDKKKKKKSLHQHVKLQTMTCYLLAFFFCLIVFTRAHTKPPRFCVSFFFHFLFFKTTLLSLVNTPVSSPSLFLCERGLRTKIHKGVVFCRVPLSPSSAKHALLGGIGMHMPFVILHGN